MIIHCYLHLPFYLKGYLLSLKSVSKSLRCLAYKRFTSPVCPASGEALSGSLLPTLSSLIHRLQLAKLRSGLSYFQFSFVEVAFEDSLFGPAFSQQSLQFVC